jgi:excisionase family DNA binding protein
MAEHRERIGPALWEFLWAIDRTTKEITDDQGQRWGVVLGGQPVTMERVAEESGGTARTARRNIERLVREGYLDVTRAPHGLIVRVARSKKRGESVEEYLTVREIAKKFKVGISTVHRIIKAGRLPGIWFGATVRVASADVQSYIEQNRVAQPNQSSKCGVRGRAYRGKPGGPASALGAERP